MSLKPDDSYEAWDACSSYERAKACLFFLWYNSFLTDDECDRIEKRIDDWADQKEDSP